MSSNTDYLVKRIEDVLSADDFDPVQVIVASYCNMYQPYDKTAKGQPMALTLRDSPVMEVLGKALTNDLNSKEASLSETCKLNFKACSLCCLYCRRAVESMAASGIRVNFDCPQP
ncbi:hypothetical protein AVEN_117944-1 [Araneus ventricosus]|uniref:Uncharacterized protein n=1 Tax=Araneus ventricosus TaxID=182803 RepID=A0A4Y2KUN8_ARAVE|nr:hypothetical protein AVEN_117944-1 [Araneus ventricosus]